ncbi:citrate synthase, peroxisomal [Cyclospora cayetanensis]|uniref:Citrate synthase n=1 Tax=Cyclospora cayetanensis TaxID=88456 RepID=A0A6P6RR01_9EIME|nr:citrate synthase, peroxisomal [Cyclospora cayetanensis]
MLGALKGQLSPAIALSEEYESRQSLRIIDERTGKEYKVPIRHNTVEAKGFLQIRAPGGPPLHVLDPGLMNTCVAGSRISFIDGEKGILRYRGYPIEHLAEKSSYEEVVFLLIYGDMPTPHQLEEFVSKLALLSAMPEQIKSLIRSFDRHAEGLSFVEPQTDLGLVGSFLQMIDNAPPSPTIARALEVLMILHAEHEMNCSTAAVRHVASSHADLYISLAAGVAALYGPRHGAANEAAVRMLRRIAAPSHVPQFLENVKRREEKLMGFGHRIYKSYDPRAFIVRQVARVVFATLGPSDLSNVATALEKAALKDVYFTSRRLYPNIDFYSGVVYTQLGFAPNSFPLLFAVARLAGWAAHLNEYHQMAPNAEEARMVRPLQVYRGQGERREEILRKEREQVCLAPNRLRRVPRCMAKQKVQKCKHPRFCHVIECYG